MWCYFNLALTLKCTCNFILPSLPHKRKNLSVYEEFHVLVKKARCSIARARISSEGMVRVVGFDWNGKRAGVMFRYIRLDSKNINKEIRFFSVKTQEKQTRNGMSRLFPVYVQGRTSFGYLFRLVYYISSLYHWPKRLLRTNFSQKRLPFLWSKNLA